MAEAIEKIIKIETGDGERSVKSLKKEISDLKDALLNTEKGTVDYETIVKRLIKDQQDLADVTKLNAKNNDAAKDSIVGMEKEYKAMYDTYKLLSKEQRETDFGKNMAKSLKTLKEELNDTKMAVGNFKDNIGNYTKSAMEAFKGLGGSVSALQGPISIADNGFKALSMNPVMLFLTTLIAIIAKVAEGIKGNEELQNRWNTAMAAFKPIGEAVTNMMDKLASAVVWVAEGVGKLIRRLNKASQETMDLAAAQNAYNDAKRDAEVLNEQDNAEIARLKNLAAQTKDAAEKAKYLNDAKEKQAEIDQRNLELARENLRLLEEEAQRGPNSEEFNDRLAQAKRELAQAEAAVDANAESFNKTLTKLNSTLDNTASKAGKTKSTFDTIQESLMKDIDNMSFNTDVKIDDVKFTDNGGKASAVANSRIAMLASAYSHEVAMAEASLDNVRTVEEKKAELYANFTAQKMAIIDEAIKHETDPEKMIELFQARQDLQNEIEEEGAKKRLAIAQKEADDKKKIFSAMNTIMGTVADSYGDYIKKQVETGKISEKEGERQFEFVKALQYAQVIMNGISAGWDAFKGIEAATGGWGTVAAYAQMAAVVASSIASAMQIKNTTLSGSGSATAPTGNISMPAIVRPAIDDTYRPNYTRNLTTAAEEEELNKPSVVSVVDIENALDLRKVRVAESQW